MARNTRFAEELRRRMVRRRMNGAQLARRAGIAQASVSFYLSGDRVPGRDILEKMAPVLAWPIDEAWRVAVGVDVEPAPAPALSADVEDVASGIAERMSQLQDVRDRQTLRSLVLDMADSFVRSRRVNPLEHNEVLCSKVPFSNLLSVCSLVVFLMYSHLP